MEIRVLGPVELELGGRRLGLGGPKQRALLSLLALNANLTVSVDRLIEGLWGEEPPASAAKMVQLYVSQLRKLLAEEAGAEIVTHGRGYELRLDREAVDAARFERLVAEASRGDRNGGPGEAAHRALGLWRGPPLADLVDEPFAAAEARRLEELHLVALELAIESDLEAGRDRELIGRLDSLVAEYPLRERLHGLRMLALYRAGRQAEALEAYRAARTALVEQVGAEPGPELRRLQEAILRHDPALELAALELPAELAQGSPALVGRGAELDRLRAAWRQAGAGSGRVLLVSGARGIGKTRLVAELAGELHAQGATVVYVGGAAPGAGALEQARRASGAGLLVFDDLDRASAEIVRGAAGLAAGARERSLLLVLAYRDDPPSAAVTRLARELEAQGAERLALRPLGADGVREIAALYAGERAASAPVGHLLEVSGGLPQRIHDVVADWTRRETVERVGARAGRAAARRGELRELESELASNVVELHTVRDRAERYSATPRHEEPGDGDEGGIPVCPFKGLASYDVADADYFFGRERLVAEMVARLVGASLLGVVGPSGSGKSSAVRAGLLPALASGVLPGSERWRCVLFRPGEHPLAELRRALGAADGTNDPISSGLGRLQPDARLLLVVDQFEETFAACRDEAGRAAFMDALADAAQRHGGRVLVVLALRADYYGACAAHPRLSRLLGASQVLVGPMQRDELARAIEGPARKAGLLVEPELVTRLVDDVAGQAGGLPLLSTALLELWQRREGRRMRLAAYERTRGVRGAVPRLAEQAYGRLTEDEQRAARRILLRLAGSGDGDAVVRRRVPLDELEADRDEQAARVLEVLTASRLVMVGEGTAEVAHEALLREWPRLRSWLEEDAEGRRLHQHLIHAARDWQAAGRDRGELYRGARLASALDWVAGHEGELNELERAFIDASRAEAEREAERQRRANRRLRTLLAGLAALLALALVAGVVALNQRGEARDAALAADAQRLGAEALNEERLDQALLLTRAAVELDESPATRSNLLSVLLRNPAALGVVDYGWRMFAAAISPDGTLIAVGDERGSVAVYDAATRRPVGKPYWIQGGLIQQVRFSPDGRTLAISSLDPDDPAHNAVVDLVDPRSGERRLRVQLPPLREPAPYVVANVVFLPGGGDLLVRQIHGAFPDGPASPMYRVDGETGAPTARLRVGRYTSYGYASETADRQRVFLTSARDDRTWELDPQPLRVVRSYPVGDLAGAVSPDGMRFALGSQEGRVRLLDLSSGRIRSLSGRHDGSVLRMSFTPDGRTLVTSGEDGRVLAWDVERGSIAQRLSAHSGPIDGLDLSGDGRTLITAATDTRAILWDLAGDRRLDRRFDVGRRFAVFQTPRGIAVSPDGRTLALTHSDGAVDLIDTRTLRRRVSLRAVDGNAASLGFSPDGRLLAVTGEVGRLRLWNARTLAPAGELKGMRASSQALAFSPDGSLLAAAEVDVRRPRPLRVWDVRRRTLTAFRGRTAAASIAFSPDGKLLAAAAIERGTDIRDVRTGRIVKRLRIGDFSGEGDFSRSVAFSPDGDLLFVGQYDGRGHLYSTDTWKAVGQPLEGHTARITFPEFSPDGRMLVTAAADGTVVLWDVETQKPIGAPLQLEPNTFASTALSPDGSRLFAVSTRGQGISFELSPEAWKRHACLVAGRELTAREWEDALPERPYQAVCSGD
jgi:WD40 repeat protein/DNA-binding SARP family transcriptional activator